MQKCKRQNQDKLFFRVCFGKSLFSFCDESDQKYFITLSVGRSCFLLYRLSLLLRIASSLNRETLKGGFEWWQLKAL